MKVLVVFANPRGTNPLRLGEEDRTIQECIRRSKNRDNLSLAIRHAATVDDIRRALLDDEYEIVHFSGHGTGSALKKTRARFTGFQNDISALMTCFLTRRRPRSIDGGASPALRH